MSATLTPAATVYTSFVDRLNQPVRIERSPLEDEPAVWITCDEAADAGPNEPKPLLGLEDARALRDALDAFILEHDRAVLTSVAA